MLTIACLIAVVVSLLLHEYLVTRAGLVRPAAHVRRVILFALMLASVGLGDRAQLAAGLDSGIATWRTRPIAFDLLGDPFLQEALTQQRPERPFPSRGTPADVHVWQQHLVETLRLRSEYPVAAESPAAVDVVQTELVGTVRRTFLRFISWDGTAIPAYVHQPDGQSNLGAVLVIPGHGAGIRATAGIRQADYQHSSALELARHGYVTLTPELRGFGLLTPDGASAHRAVAHTALAAGSFYKAVVARDLGIALTVLQRWEGVDPARLAVAGASLGGEIAVFLGALDPRPRVILSHSNGGVVGPTSVAEVVTDQARQTPHGCHLIPGVNRLLWQEDWFRVLAPRAVQVVRGTQDVSGRARLNALGAAASEAFAAFDAQDRVEIVLEPGGHEFFVEPAVRFLGKWL